MSDKSRKTTVPDDHQAVAEALAALTGPTFRLDLDFKDKEVAGWMDYAFDNTEQAYVCHDIFSWIEPAVLVEAMAKWLWAAAQYELEKLPPEDENEEDAEWRERVKEQEATALAIIVAIRNYGLESLLKTDKPVQDLHKTQ